MSVVDAKLKVYAIGSPRIPDGSVKSRVISGNMGSLRHHRRARRRGVGRCTQFVRVRGAFRPGARFALKPRSSISLRIRRCKWPSKNKKSWR